MQNNDTIKVNWTTTITVEELDIETNPSSRYFNGKKVKNDSLTSSWTSTGTISLFWLTSEIPVYNHFEFSSGDLEYLKPESREEKWNPSRR